MTGDPNCPICLGSGAQCEACLNRRMVQVGWRSKLTGEICDCPVYERSPHADSEPVYVAVSDSPWPPANSGIGPV